MTFHDAATGSHEAAAAHLNILQRAAAELALDDASPVSFFATGEGEGAAKGHPVHKGLSPPADMFATP